MNYNLMFIAQYGAQAKLLAALIEYFKAIESKNQSKEVLKKSSLELNHAFQESCDVMNTHCELLKAQKEMKVA